MISEYCLLTPSLCTLHSCEWSIRLCVPHNKHDMYIYISNNRCGALGVIKYTVQTKTGDLVERQVVAPTV